MQSLLNLYILCFNKISQDYDIVSTQPETFAPIECEVSVSEPIYSSLHRIFYNYIKLDSSFINFILSDVSIIEEKLIISYYCWIPFETKIQKSFLIPIDSPISPKYASIFNQILQKI